MAGPYNNLFLSKEDCSELIKFMDFHKTEEQLKSEVDTNTTVPDMTKMILNLITIFSNESPLRDAASSVFREFELYSITFPKAESDYNHGRLVLMPGLFEHLVWDGNLLEKVVIFGGSEITKLTLIGQPAKYSYHDENNDMVSKFVDLIVANCHKIDEITLSHTWKLSPDFKIEKKLLQKYGSTLRTLRGWDAKVITAPVIPNINIRIFELLGSEIFTGDLESILDKIGESLEDLTIGVRDWMTFSIVDAIEQKAKNLNRLILRNEFLLVKNIGKERYTSFITSYGPKLNVTNLPDNLDKQQYISIKTECSNLKIESFLVCCTGPRLAQETTLMSVFGDRIKILYITLKKNQNYRNSDLEKVMNQCKNLEKLQISDDRQFDPQFVEQWNSIQAILLCAAPFHRLKELMLSGIGVSQENILAVAETTGNLRRFIWNIPNVISNDFSFKTITEKNLNLKTVFLNEQYDEQPNERRKSTVILLIHLMTVFSKCANISLDLEKSLEPIGVTEDLMKNICDNRLVCPKANVFIHVNGIEYTRTGNPIDQENFCFDHSGYEMSDD